MSSSGKKIPSNWIKIVDQIIYDISEQYGLLYLDKTLSADPLYQLYDQYSSELYFPLKDGIELRLRYKITIDKFQIYLPSYGSLIVDYYDPEMLIKISNYLEAGLPRLRGKC